MRKVFVYSLFMFVMLSAAGAMPAVYASNVNYVPLAPIDVQGSEFRSDTPGGCVAPTCFPKYLRTIYNVGVAIAGLFVVFSIVRGGFTLIFTDSILGHSEAKGIILRALGGAVIVYSSYIFMNTINPALGRDLDLALSFPRITILKDTQPLTAIEISQYQLDLLKDYRVLNDKWRTDEKTRLQGEIAGLETELARATDEEERAIIQGNINIKKADLATLEREGVAKGTERDALTAFQDATTPEQLATLIDKITNAGGGLDKMHQAFDKMIADVHATPEQAAFIRASEAERVASVERNLVLGIMEHPPTTAYKNNVTGATYLGVDGAKVKTLVAERVTAIDAARTRALGKLAALEGDPSIASNPEAVTKIANQEKVVWNQNCNVLAQVSEQCKFRNLACDVPASMKTQCNANSTIRF